MERAAYEVAQVLERNREHLAGLCANSWPLRTLHALRKCRTAALGGHIDRCDNPDCHRLHLSYNSCRNRHCPKCQGHKREQWIRAREAELLNVPYFHVVFTLPSELNRICLYDPKTIYNLLFATAWQVIKGFSSNPNFLGADPGMVAILHTWGQNLSLHPHLHCIVPGGGISRSGKWKPARNKGKYLFPVKAMSNVFRARFVAGLRKSLKKELPCGFCESLFRNEWVVYCKRPFLGPAQVVEYLGRYTHKIAIGNHRIKNLDGQGITFSVKDYRHAGKKSLMLLSEGFVRIRHYGILSSSKKKELLPILQKVLGGQVPNGRPPLKHRRCPYCQIGIMATVAVFDSRGPPKAWSDRLKKSAPRTTLQEA